MPLWFDGSAPSAPICVICGQSFGGFAPGTLFEMLHAGGVAGGRGLYRLFADFLTAGAAEAGGRGLRPNPHENEVLNVSVPPMRTP